MKTLSTSVILLLALCQPIVSLQAREMIIAVSPNLHSEEAKAQAAQLLQFLTTLEPGDRAIVLDGFNLSTIGTFSVPSRSSYNSPRAKLGANQPFVGALMQFADASVLKPLMSPGSLRLPQLLRHIGANFASSDQTDVVILGSPFYESDNQFSMRGSRIPSDGHINSSRSDTPYGTADQPGLLANLRVHLGYGYEEMMDSDRHHFYIQRFWTLYIEALGGSLASFTADHQTLFQRALRSAEAPAHNYVLNATERLEMILLQPESQVNEQSIYEREISEQKLSSEYLNNAEFVQLAISWDCQSCDIDLYARPSPTSVPLYYRNTETTEGTYIKDFRTSPNTLNGFETITFHVPIDLEQLLILVHFFDGYSPGGVRGEIRLSVEGLTYATPFHIPGEVGGNDIDFEANSQSIFDYAKSNVAVFWGWQLVSTEAGTQGDRTL